MEIIYCRSGLKMVHHDLQNVVKKIRVVLAPYPIQRGFSQAGCCPALIWLHALLRPARSCFVAHPVYALENELLNKSQIWVGVF